jgi:DNA-binding transcriptional regulator YdaS (Cro superfamily)
MDLKKYVDNCGSQSEAAEIIGCTQGMISHWLTGRNRMTAEKAIEIEMATDGLVLRHDLRPDIFGKGA